MDILVNDTTDMVESNNLASSIYHTTIVKYHYTTTIFICYLYVSSLARGSCARLPQDTHVMLMAPPWQSLCCGGTKSTSPFHHVAAWAAGWAIAFDSKRGAWVCSTTYFNPARFWHHTPDLLA